MCKFRALVARLFDMPHHFYGQICVQRGHIGHVDPFIDQNSKIFIFLGYFTESWSGSLNYGLDLRVVVLISMLQS